MNQTKIPIIQLIFIAITNIGLSVHVLLIPPLIQTAGRDAWLSIFIALVITLLWSWLLLTLHRKTNGMNIIKWIDKYISKSMSMAIYIFISFFSTVTAAVTLRETITWTSISFLPETPKFLLVVILILACWYTSTTNISSLASLNVFILIFIVAFGIFVSIANTPEKDISLLQPFLENGIQPVLNGTLYQLSGMGEVIFFILLQHKVSKPYQFKHFVYISIILTGLTLGPLIGSIIEFGPIEAGRQRFPAYEQWGLVAIGDFIEHLDFLSLYQWLSGAFIRISTHLFIIRELNLKKKHTSKWLFIPVLVISCLALLPINDSIYIHFLHFYYFPSTCILIFIFSFVLYLLVVIKPFRKQEKNYV
ncbi:endospore germination permease [Cytobacillus sp. Sa5YUA1]|uniref:Endospore germination permease n=1 Tax=Cytobacillus stercorigallinarum TaxID=2762240 RepID=A0ABR8QLU0_9BACI|nr:endospore germination permease [Cytobacillus stercorigallinarum]MBD7936432.1 endospore germination permease [Cytobacillus stercorigallinarum]